MIAWRLNRLYLLASGVAALLALAAPGEAFALSERGWSLDDEKTSAPLPITICWKSSADLKKGKSTVEVTGAPEWALEVLKAERMTADHWRSFFAIRVLNDDRARDPKAPSLWGKYEVRGKVIRFIPRFPLERGIRYRADFDSARMQAAVKELDPGAAIPKPGPSPRTFTADFFQPKGEDLPPTRVAAVYPSGAALPENLLRFYIHFSAPMGRGEAYRHLKLIDTATGKPVHAPFLELEEELWSPDGKRFTLFIDPGRIKRGLKPREMFGPVLEAGKSYRLVVDRGWTDAAGNGLQSEFRRTFRAGPPDESMPDPKKWSVVPPRADSRDALEARFPEPLDRALLERLVGVLDAEGRELAGAVSIAEAETVWRFVPRDSWREGTYRLVVGSELEDVAGNSVAAPFEVDLTTPITKRVASDRVEVPFMATGARRTR